MRDPTQEKRILVEGKSKGETLLDATLSESCFERVARSGIAVSVWEDVVGTDGKIGSVGAVGGVSGARARVFMIQVSPRVMPERRTGVEKSKDQNANSWNR
jgi:hypothetical protein